MYYVPSQGNFCLSAAKNSTFNKPREMGFL